MGDSEFDRRPITRRDLIKRGAIVGGVAVWGVPLIKLAVSGDDLPTQTLSGAALVVFPGTCDPTLLDDPSHTRLVCAKSATAAETAFKSAVKAPCAAKCAESTSCASGTACNTNKRTPTTVGAVICVETGNLLGCPLGPYARGSKEFTCVGVVTCNCLCR